MLLSLTAIIVVVVATAAGNGFSCLYPCEHTQKFGVDE